MAHSGEKHSDCVRKSASHFQSKCLTCIGRARGPVGERHDSGFGGVRFGRSAERLAQANHEAAVSISVHRQCQKFYKRVGNRWESGELRFSVSQNDNNKIKNLRQKPRILPLNYCPLKPPPRRNIGVGYEVRVGYSMSLGWLVDGVKPGSSPTKLR